MTEPQAPYFTQCPARYYSYGEYRHCVSEHGHTGVHYHPDGGWEGASLYWEEIGKPEEPRLPIAYIAGPMTGKKDWNFPAFMKAADKIRALGYSVINPAEQFGGATDLPREVYMKAAVENVLKADTVFKLRGWDKSEGAKLEVAVAKACGKEVKGL